MHTHDKLHTAVTRAYQRVGLKTLLFVTVSILLLAVYSISRLNQAQTWVAAQQRYPGTSHAAPPVTEVARSAVSPTPSQGSTPLSLQQEIETLQAKGRLFYFGNTHLPEVALTFDDGPNPTYTPQVLRVLQRYHLQATFFCIGEQVAAYPGLVRQELLAGNEVGNHSWSHPDLSTLSEPEIASQISRTSAALQQVTGAQPTLFRPPYGALSTAALAEVLRQNLTAVLWNDEARDWARPGTATIVERIMRLVGDGAIILLHDGGGDRSQTVAALPTIITLLQARGFRIVPMQKLIQDANAREAASGVGQQSRSSALALGDAPDPAFMLVLTPLYTPTRQAERGKGQAPVPGVSRVTRATCTSPARPRAPEQSYLKLLS